MAIALKNKRKITVNQKQYAWSVGEDYDSAYILCNIVAYDKSLILSIPLKAETCYIISKGTHFQSKEVRTWNRYKLPFLVPEVVTPRFISRIIYWATECRDAELIEYNGRDVTL